jgi:carbon-monoxide dehydrogenase medium subunit
VYTKPKTLEAALAALADHGRGAQILAGGTDLVPWLRDDVIAPAALVDIKAIPDLHLITDLDGALHLGALVTFSDLLASPHVIERYPILVEMGHLVASAGIRNRATLVGNICSAVPSCDAGPVLLVYETEVHVVGPDGRRDVAIGDWFDGPRTTTLRPNEIVTGLTIHPPAEPHGAAFLKLARYEGEDLAQANLAVMITGAQHYRVAYGAVAPTPSRASAVERLLAGETLDADRLAAAQQLVTDEIAPITDMRATKEYREHMCRVMLARGLRAAQDRLNGAGPPCPARLI